jgi:beta-lactam-binding protein with PASTA domain
MVLESRRGATPELEATTFMNGSSVFLVALLTAVAAAAGTVYVIERYGLLPHAQTAEVLVPDLRGVPEADARANAIAAHIALLVASREPTTEGKSGTVIRQSMAAGQRVPRDYPVSIVLAEEIPKVPSIVGVTVGEATRRLDQQGYHLQIGGTVASPDAGIGLIVDQSPKADTAQAKGGTVSVQVSSGAGDIEMPKLLGVGITQAKTDLEKLGLKPTVRWVAMAETPTYIVLNQKPAPGEKVKPGGEVQLTACR